MEMNGECVVPVPQQAAWDALNDPEVLKACIPGCEILERDEDGSLRAVVRAAVGPVRARFKGRVTMSDVAAPESYRLAFQGEGAAGFAQGESQVRLVPSESGSETTIHYTAQAKIGGKLAQVGSRLIDSAAKKIAGEFFTNLVGHFGGNPQDAAEGGDADRPGGKKGVFGFFKKGAEDAAAE